MATSLFLTGATGYAGQSVLAELTRQGHAVTALVRKGTTLSGCRTVVGELAALDRCAAEIASAGGIVHLASPRTLERESVLRDDILGTSLLIDAWHTGSFVYASSPTVQAVPLLALKESSPIDVANWYDMGKLSNESQLRLAQPRERRGAAIILRPGLFFNANQRRHDRQYLAEIYRMCQVGGKFVFDSEEGLQSYGTSFIGGTDFGRVIAAALTIGTSGTYNVAGGDFTWWQLITTINRYAGTKADFVIRSNGQPESGEWRVHQSRFYLDTGAFKTKTGFVPQQSCDELVEAFVQSERAAEPG
jgi:nucleoside-diphosphate-sugar epimerase